ncbi:VQ motif-containing protein 11 [Euphorbia lathyris]|uniref:VQ motif-containing protein 11 n=1 Tax=Euphorbia lathyris TaxID=212925 RepID=UPI003313E33B
MASTSSNTAAYGDSDPPSPNTTFVQADPSTFRTIVQKLTGAPDDPSAQKLPISHSNRPLPVPGPKRPAFKLNERRQSAKNLQINLINNNNSMFQFRQQRGGSHLLVSPVSTLDFIASRMSPRSPCDEEERAIAEKGFYLHPISPLCTPRGAEPPELLPLFPLRSPSDIADGDDDDDRTSCS